MMRSCSRSSHHAQVKLPEKQARVLRSPFSIKKAKKSWAGSCRTKRRCFSEGSMGGCDRTGAWSGATEPEWWSHKSLPHFPRQKSPSAGSWGHHLPALLTPYLNALWTLTHFLPRRVARRRAHGCLAPFAPPEQQLHDCVDLLVGAETIEEIASCKQRLFITLRTICTPCCLEDFINDNELSRGAGNCTKQPTGERDQEKRWGILQHLITQALMRKTDKRLQLKVNDAFHRSATRLLKSNCWPH